MTNIDAVFFLSIFFALFILHDLLLFSVAKKMRRNEGESLTVFDEPLRIIRFKVYFLSLDIYYTLSKEGRRLNKTRT